MDDVIDYIEKKQEQDMHNNAEEISRQINEKDTPQKKLSRDNQLMLKTGEIAKQIKDRDGLNMVMEKGEFSTSNHRLYKYDLNFKQFFKTISEIINNP